MKIHNIFLKIDLAAPKNCFSIVTRKKLQDQHGMFKFKRRSPHYLIGIHFQSPYFYLVEIKIIQQQLKLLRDYKVFLEQWEAKSNACYIAALPWRSCCLIESEIPEPYSFYLGLKQGKPFYLKPKFVNTNIEEQLLRLGKIGTLISILEIDVLALWNLAYWYLSKVNGYGEILIWIYQTLHGYYFLLGRDDLLWEARELTSLASLSLCLDTMCWPRPKRVMLFHELCIDDLDLKLPCTLVSNSSPAEVMALALAIRGAYAAV